ncbi:hypothetical protein Tco_0461812 [Tanacetum coccineum]
MNSGSPKTWLKFYNHDYTRESKKEYKATYKVLMKKETEVPEALDLINFGTIHGGRTLQELDEFCRVSFRTPFSYPIITGQYTVKEKVMLADLFYFRSMDGGELVDVPWHVAKFLYDNAKVVQKKSKIIGAHLIGRIARHLGLMSHAALRVAKIVADRQDDSDEEFEAAEARRVQEKDEGVLNDAPT